VNEYLTGHNSQPSFSRNILTSSMREAWYWWKYRNVCSWMPSSSNSDLVPENSSPTDFNLGTKFINKHEIHRTMMPEKHIHVQGSKTWEHEECRPNECILVEKEAGCSMCSHYGVPSMCFGVLFSRFRTLLPKHSWQNITSQSMLPCFFLLPSNLQSTWHCS